MTRLTLITAIALLLTAPTASAADPQRVVQENIEWLDVWVPGNAVKGQPRVLLIGDSITRGYYKTVEDALKGKAVVCRLATSKGLGQMWVKLCKRLREAGVAHADVQHGNVLLVPGSRQGAYGLKLIDYDGMYLPALANTPSGEAGHPSYQHPARAASRAYSPDLDRFPHLVVATALRGLSVGGPALWERYDTGDNLLFTEEDYKRPAESKLMRELWQTEDPALQALVGRLAVACGRPITQTPWLDQFAPEGEPAPLDAAGRREAADVLGIALPVPIASHWESSEPERPAPPAPLKVPMAVEPDPVAATSAPPSEIPVALPTEPTAATPSPEVPTAVAEPTPVTPSEPLSSTTPAPNPFAFPPAQAEPDTRIAAPAPVRKPARGGAKRPQANTRLLLVAGSALLLVGVVVAGVLVAGGSKPDETVQQPPEEPTTPAPRGNREAPKPTEHVPVPPALVAPEQLTVRHWWAVELGPDFADAKLVCSADSQVVVAVGPKGPSLALEAATGKQLPGGFEPVTSRSRLATLSGHRFAVVGPSEAVQVVDPRAANPGGGPLLPAQPKATAQRFLSPDAKYVATGETGRGQPTPFTLKSVKPEKTVLEFAWVRGQVFFPVHSSRVLVVEGGGRCRWFALPSGQPDGEWTIPVAKSPGTGVCALSADGFHLLYDGRLAGHDGEYHLIDTHSGKVYRSFRGAYEPHGRSLSADASLVLLPGRDQERKLRHADVIDTATGTVVAELAAPPGCDHFTPTLIPDGSGVVAAVEGPTHALVRYELTAPSGKSKEPPPSPGEPPALKLRWSHVVEAPYATNGIHVDQEPGVIALASSRGGFMAFNFGGKGQTGFAGLDKSGVASFFALDRGRFGTVTTKFDAVTLWDGKTGAEVGKLTIPEIPPGVDKATQLRVFLSPNGKYLVVVRVGNRTATHPEVPFRVFDTANMKPVVSTDWKGGSVHFTADSSRVLVAEWSGRFRWFKLPSGAADGGWEYPSPGMNRLHQVTGISGNGSVVGYNGPVDSKIYQTGPKVIDGKTGQVIRQLPRDYANASPVYVSGDGRRLAAQRNGNENGRWYDVIDARIGIAVGRAALPPGRGAPLFALSKDSRALVVGDPDEKKVYLFDVVPVGKAP